MRVIGRAVGIGHPRDLGCVDQTPLNHQGFDQRAVGFAEAVEVALTVAVKAQREADKATRASKSGGKRGRPKSALVSAPQKPKSPTGGKRGRRPLTAEVLSKRAADAVATRKRSGGKRGRPKRG